MKFDTYNEWMQATHEHDCGNPVILACDEYGKAIGWLCVTCDEWFLLNFWKFKKTMPTNMRKELAEASFRQEMAKSFTHFRIVIRKEIEM